jgi:hypothetical protein
MFHARGNCHECKPAMFPASEVATSDAAAVTEY